MPAGFNIYRGQDDPSAIDYGTVIGFAAAGSEEIETGVLSWPAGSTWWIAVRRVSAAGIESDPELLAVRIDGAGELVPVAPNPVLLLAARAIAAGKVRAAWAYHDADEQTLADHFAVFLAVAPAAFNWAVPTATVAYAGPGRYRWDSGSQADGAEVRIAVRSVAAAGVGGADDGNTDYVEATADAVAPDAADVVVVTSP